MNTRTCFTVLGICAAVFVSARLPAAEAVSGPLNLNVTSNGVKTVAWPRLLIPALETNRLAVGSNAASTTEIARDAVSVFTNGYAWSTSNGLPYQFFSLTLGQMSSNALLTATVLNRLAYGPTPDELERVTTIGPQAYIDEQIQPQNIPNQLGNYIIQTTNGVSLPPNSNWTTISVTGTVTASTLYIYLAGVGDAYIDDVQLSVIYTNFTYVTNVTSTNIVIITNATTYLGPNVVANGDFELPVTTGWVRSPDFATSTVVGSPVYSGAGSLHIIATGPGTGNNDAITQANIPGLTNGHRCVLSFTYLTRPNSGAARVNVRLSNGGVMASDANPPPQPQWIYAKATGVATATPTFYFYLSGAGEVYIDDAKLVAGNVAETGPNLLRNGDFEAPLATNDWQRTADFTNSMISNTRSHSGNGSLRLIATAAGNGNNDSVYQANIAGLTSGQTYTVSFWYSLPTRYRTLTARLSGSATPGLLRADVPGSDLLQFRFDTINTPNPDNGLVTVNSLGGGTLADLRAWLVLNAVGSPRQLLEILTQFLENHFVTEQSKSRDYLDRYYDDGNVIDVLATDWEYREVNKWRNALLNPNCNFYDLLEISAKSPAQIVYLDTVESRGDGNRIANENYARELLELFCMGVDNGYDQLDITAMSRAWTGWSIDIVDRENIDNPFALQSRTYGFFPNTSGSGISNLVGVFTFNYKTNFHGANQAPILSDWPPTANRTNLVAVGSNAPPKRYAARLGSPWMGTPYQIILARRTGNSGIQDGYDVIQSLASNIYTAEYISVKLCRLFVHDNFPNPTTMTNLAEYAFYDYTNPNRSAEAELIHQCIVAWDTPGPDGRKGNIRSVLRTIFESELFRSHDGSLQKVKTPLEYTVSAIRALRSANANGTFTASTDGYAISGSTGNGRVSGLNPLVRMGNMRLFDRDAPDGYAEAAAPWISAGTLAERIRFVQTFLMSTTDTNKADGINDGTPTTSRNLNLSDPVALLKKKLPNDGSWNNPGAVADFFLSILYPAEGKANLDLYRLSAINFLNTADNGVGASAFSGLSNTGAPYDTRVRAMVSMLMSLQRFQEQ